MDFRFTDEQRFIRDTARSFLAERYPAERRHAAIADGCDMTLWRAMSEEMGWIGVAVPESAGGAGLGMVELAILMQETGRVLAAVPFFTTAGLCAPVIQAVANPAQQQVLLPKLANGASKAAMCMTGERGRPAPADLPLLSQDGLSLTLTGTSGFVAWGGAADLLLVLARAPGSAGWEGVSLLALPARGTPGLSVIPQISLDPTRPYATICFADVAVAPDAVLGRPEGAGPGARKAFAIAAALLAAEQLGGAEAVLEMSVAYAKQREQFGRPIGGFQAVKHMLADMMLQVETARSAAYYAACTIDETPGEMEEAAAIARSHCSDAFNFCAGQAIQVHGGIGFTWEHDAHLYFKRARSSSTLLGSPTHARAALADMMGLGPLGDQI